MQNARDKLRKGYTTLNPFDRTASRLFSTVVVGLGEAGDTQFRVMEGYGVAISTGSQTSCIIYITHHEGVKTDPRGRKHYGTAKMPNTVQVWDHVSEGGDHRPHRPIPSSVLTLQPQRSEKLHS